MSAPAIRTYLDFEKPIAELESKVADLQTLASGEDSVSITDELHNLQQKAEQALADTYAKLTPWQKTQVARHPDRPHCMAFALGRGLSQGSLPRCAGVLA